jgi:CRISPR system Cascade subunit CasA
MRPHQFRPWLMFLAQLAAIALKRADEDNPARDEDVWRRLLLALTDGNREPWCLVVSDLARPAFFQPPVPERSLDAWKVTGHPDDLDILVTAKAHDVKTSLIPADDFEAWVYSLVTLQTMEGFLGQGNYGIARMNGGFGNRPYLSLAPDLRITSGFRRDVDVLLATWPALLEGHGYAEQGAALLWLHEWNGRESFRRGDLSPHFIEVCRRLRLERAASGLRCRRASSRVRRALPDARGGDVGDPWIPVKKVGRVTHGADAQATVLTVGERGFDYQLLSELLLENAEYEAAAASIPRAADGDLMVFSAWALARGQGTTDGLHERAITVKGTAHRWFRDPEARLRLGRRAGLWIGIADKMRAKVLFPALKHVTQSPQTAGFSARLDEVFFDQLFGSLEESDDDARIAFEGLLQAIAWGEFQRAIDTCPLPQAQRLRLVSEAERVFNACFRKHFSDTAGAPGGVKE